MRVLRTCLVAIGALCISSAAWSFENCSNSFGFTHELKFNGEPLCVCAATTTGCTATTAASCLSKPAIGAPSRYKIPAVIDSSAGALCVYSYSRNGALMSNPSGKTVYVAQRIIASADPYIGSCVKESVDCDADFYVGGKLVPPSPGEVPTLAGQMHDYSKPGSTPAADWARKVADCKAKAAGACLSDAYFASPKDFHTKWLVDFLKKNVPASEAACAKGVLLTWKAVMGWCATAPKSRSAGEGSCQVKVPCAKVCTQTTYAWQ